MQRIIISLVCLTLIGCGGATTSSTAGNAPAVATAPTAQTANISEAVNATLTAIAKSAPTNTPIPNTPSPSPPTVASKDGVQPLLCKMDTLCANPEQTVGLQIAKTERRFNVGNQFVQPLTGYDYIIAWAVVGNGAKTPMPYNPLYFKVRASTGVEYNADIVATSSIPEGFKTGTLPSGDAVAGMVVFQVPATAKGFILSYQPLTFPQPGQVRVELDR